MSTIAPRIEKCDYYVIPDDGLLEANIINIGNSKGLRLSKTILEKYKIGDKVEVILEKEQIILRPIAETRKGWEGEFRRMRKMTISFS